MKMEAGLVTQRHINNHEFREFTRIDFFPTTDYKVLTDYSFNHEFHELHEFATPLIYNIN